MILWEVGAQLKEQTQHKNLLEERQVAWECLSEGGKRPFYSKRLRLI